MKPGVSRMDREALAWIVLARLPQIAGRRCATLVQHFGSAQTALAAPEKEWAALIGYTYARKARASGFGWDQAEKEAKRLEAIGGKLLTWESTAYPALLREIAGFPPLLCTVGPAVLDGPLIGIVGGRKAGSNGIQTAYKLAAGLAERGIGVVSGLALGIDAAAHEGALAAGGRTIAVLGCGVDYIYPAANRGLYSRIVQSGAIISEFPMEARPEPGWFPRRNRLISGLALGVIMVEAGRKSGALITANYALEQNREVFAVPGEVLHGRSAGCHRLIQDGAQLVENVDDVLKELAPQLGNWSKPTVVTNELISPSLTAEEEALVACLDRTEKHVDELAQQAGRSTGDVLGVLLQLELSGVVEQLPGKHFIRSKV